MLTATDNVSSSETGDAKLNDAQKELGIRLMKFREDQPQLTRQTLRDMQNLVNDYRETCKRRGINFPKQRVVAFVAMDHVCVWPQEMDQAEIKKRLRMFIIHRQRHNRSIDADDLARGVRRAYPDYSPSRFTLVCPETTKTN